MARIASLLLMALQAFVALTAVVGGIATATGIDKLPPEWLEGIPFASYCCPACRLQ